MKAILYFPSLVFLGLSGVIPLSAQWEQVYDGYPTRCLAVSGTNLFAGTSGGVLYSTDNGISWTQTGLRTGIQTLTASGTDVYAATSYGVHLYTEIGTRWISLSSPGDYVVALAVSGTNLFAGTDGGGVFLTTNNGTSWTSANTGLIYLVYTRVRALAISGTNLFVGIFDAGYYGGIYLSTNNGTSWTHVSTGLENTDVTALAVSGVNLFAGTVGHGNYCGVYLSTNNGTSWTKMTVSSSSEIYVLALSGTNLFAGTPSGVILFINNGTSWTKVGTGFPAGAVYGLAISDSYLFAATQSGVWRRPLSEMITSADVQTTNPPVDFGLQPNYPNPFNPSTTIRYGLPSRSHVTLTVFNTLGQQVATIVQGEQEAGFHEAVFDASGLASGVYLYRLQAGDFVQTKRLLLLR